MNKHLNSLRNTAGMRAAVLRRSEDARCRAEAAINALVENCEPVNFNTVARRAGVTNAYLYSKPDLRAKIQLLRSPVVATPVVESLRVALVERDKRIDELEHLVSTLKRRLAAARQHRV